MQRACNMVRPKHHRAVDHAAHTLLVQADQESSLTFASAAEAGMRLKGQGSNPAMLIVMIAVLVIVIVIAYIYLVA